MPSTHGALIFAGGFSVFHPAKRMRSLSDSSGRLHFITIGAAPFPVLTHLARLIRGGWPLRVVGMPALAWTLAMTLALATPALANDVIIITDPQPGDPPGTVSRVEYLNSAKHTSKNGNVRRTTEYGDVVVNVQVGSAEDQHAETLSAYDIPDGLFADPEHIRVQDGESGVMFLREWLGM